MAYQKTIWKDRIKNPITGEIIEEGTLFTQERANKIEEGIEKAHRLVTDEQGAAIGIKIQDGKLQYKNGENWDDIGMEYKDVNNLVATDAGVINWGLPQAVDQTRISITLFRATKDITNLDYAACIADKDVIRTTLGKDAVSNAYTGLANSTKYWVKAFIQYAVGGEQYTSCGVAVTFTTLSIQEVTNLAVNPTTETITWTLPSGSNHIGVEIAYSKTNISAYTYAQCKSDANVTNVSLASSATSYKVDVLDKTTYYVKVFLRYDSQYSSGVAKSWVNPKQWYYRSGVENSTFNQINDIKVDDNYVTKYSTYIQMQARAKNRGVTCSGSAECKSVIKKNGVSKLFFDYSKTVSGTASDTTGNFDFRIGDDFGARASMPYGNVARTISSLNIENVNGDNILIELRAHITENTTLNVIIYNIWGE